MKRFDTAVLKQGMTESELRNYYGSIKETALNDPLELQQRQLAN